MAEQETIFDRWAKERDITVEEMRAIISVRIEKGWNDSDLKKREQWRKIPCVGEIPTPEEWLVLSIEVQFFIWAFIFLNCSGISEPVTYLIFFR